MPRVVVLDEFSSEGLKLLESVGDIDFQVCTGLKGTELRETLRRFDGALSASGVQITADTLEGNQRLKVIVQAGAGSENIDTEAATRSGIVVMNALSGNTISTAEHTIALMLALSRNIFPASRSLIEGRWDRKQYIGTQLAGKTLGIIGLGRVGQAVAARTLALEMRVLGYDPFLPSHRAKELGILPCASLRELLPQVDFLTVHTPLTEETRGMIGAEEIRLMRKGVRLVNCARGGIYDLAAVVEGLQSGHLGGVALDVFDTEPCTASPLFTMPNVLCTPHLGASTEEARARVSIEAAELLSDFFATGAIRQSLNVVPLEPKALEGLRGYMNLAHRLGLLLAQVDRSSTTGCRLRYQGEVAKRDTRLLSAAFAVGLLEHAMPGRVNIVNAEVLLRERGIQLTEERSSEVGDFGTLITAEVVSEHRTSVAAGTLFGKIMPRLVQLDDFWVESPLEGTLFLTIHRDVPGVIGSLGEVFGKHNVNIAYLSVGRRSDNRGGEAAGVLALDSRPPAEAVAEILALAPVKQACVVYLPPASQLPAWMGPR